MSFFSVSNLSAGYDRGQVIREINFSFDKGTFMGIIGANGCGKTTLLRSICGILAHEGRCVLEGTQLEGLSARRIARLCSYIPQRSGISIDLSALDVVLMGFNPRLGILERPNARMEADARKALEQVGLAGKEDDNYQYLSEGQKQLCILARTLVANSQLLLLDEPESALDFRYRYHMLDLLRSWVKEQNAGIVATLHDPSLALNYCDQLLILDGGSCLGSVSPQKDSPGQMEQILRQVYGPVSLQHMTSRSGRKQLVMIREER